MRISLLGFIFFLTCFAVNLAAQEVSYFEDFESWDAGTYMSANNADVWTTWSGDVGGTEDVVVANDLAFSGSNSIKFVGQGNGGPQDVIVDFLDQYTTGTFTLNMQMYVPVGKNGYFNLQGETEPGNIWSTEVFFETGGSLRVTKAGQLPIFNSTYPQGEWFNIIYDINLDANSWKLTINENCLGSFTNEFNGVATMDLFPIDGSAEYWIDDISFTHTDESDPLVIAFSEFAFSNLTGNKIQLELTNGGADTINTMTATLNYAGDQLSQTLTDLNVAPGERARIDFSNDIRIASGFNLAALDVSAINGEPISRSACGILRGIDVAPGRNVIAEEGTGTWCGYCPRGAVFMEYMSAKYQDRFIGIAVHNDDPMAVLAYDTLLQTTAGFSGYPFATVERGSVIDPSGLENPFLGRILSAGITSFEIGADYNPDTYAMKVSVGVSALEDLSAGHKVVVVVVEDHVQGDNSGYSQSNYFAGGGKGIMGGYENLPATVPFSQMVYDDVARFILTPYAGTDQGLADGLSAGESALFNFDLEIDPRFKAENLGIIAFVLDSDGRVDNGLELSLAEAEELGFTSRVIDPELQAGFLVYPNPVMNLMNVQLQSPEAGDVKLEIFDAYGRLVSTQAKQGFLGDVNWAVDVSDLQNGVYFVRANVGGKVAIQQINKVAK